MCMKIFLVTKYSIWLTFLQYKSAVFQQWGRGVGLAEIVPATEVSPQARPILFRHGEMLTSN